MKNFNIKYKSNFKLLKFFVVPWFLLFLFFASAFSGFTDELKVESLATIQAYIYDYVYITKVSVSESSNASSAYNVHLSNETKTATNGSTCNGYVVYDIEILNSTDQKAFITNTSVTSLLNQTGSPTNGFDVTFLDVVNNETYVNPHQTSIIKLKVKNNCSTNDTQAIVKTTFEYSLFPYHNLTINVVPSTANISIQTSDGTFTGNGTLTIPVYETDTATYSASQKYYYSQSGSHDMLSPGQDHTVDLVLEEDFNRTLAIIPNVPDQICHCYVNGHTAFNTTDYTEAVVVAQKNDDISCSVGINNTENEYYYTHDANSDTYNGFYTRFNITEDTTLTPEFFEKPWITGPYSNTVFSSAANATKKNYHPGYYFIEMWGGTGGSGQDAAGVLGKKANAPGGAAGYVYGVMYIGYEESIYYSLGGNGETKPNQKPFTEAASGGANGGGKSNAPGSSAGSGGGGGGYSALRLSNASGTLYMLAAGGGGGSGRGGAAGAWDGAPGGAGGNIKSSASSSDFGGIIYNGSNGIANKGSLYGIGGSTTAGYTKSSDFSAATMGAQFQGGNSYLSGGGGGSGYYGGGGGAKDGTGIDSNKGIGGGGGGSSFIYTSDGRVVIPSSTFASSYTGSNPSTTGGGLIITYLGKNNPL